jgi:hypothetical protein
MRKSLRCLGTSDAPVAEYLLEASAFVRIRRIQVVHDFIEQSQEHFGLELLFLQRPRCFGHLFGGMLIHACR